MKMTGKFLQNAVSLSLAAAVTVALAALAFAAPRRRQAVTLPLPPPFAPLSLASPAPHQVIQTLRTITTATLAQHNY